MLLRAVVLLFLCVSSGICATLGHYQTTPEEEQASPVDSDAVSAAVAAEEAAAPAGTQQGSSPAVEEPAADSSRGDSELAVDDLSADKTKMEVPVGDGATADEPETDREMAAGDPPAMEALAGEAVTQEQHFSPGAEEENDIRPVQTDLSLNNSLAQEDDNSWSIDSIRNSFRSLHGYFELLVELAGGRDGVCQYRCRYGETPQKRPGYQLQEPNGCSSSLVGLQVNAVLDLGIPAMTNCCNQLDVCYDTCGTSKNRCDSEFRLCLHGICGDLKKSLGFVSKVQACESMADVLHSTVGTLGCRPYMNSQRAACVCEGEEREEL
uniref:group XIIB secretory phospholipase A2-like protein isoform X1 n=1 Tax=Gasterosteus aculeatus aculeatus TaxID=481459 RepID=UPI001A98B29A|nr:group XIIB secretory phospholipase A2-like protein isoform X1 [Gasterosteus aculeatus aculeatus]